MDSEGPAEWRITVSDRGPGMSDKVMAQALVPFYSTRVDGSGIGLALSREIIEAHRGQILLRNRSEGGLSVVLTLPRLRLSQASSAPLTRYQGNNTCSKASGTSRESLMGLTTSKALSRPRPGVSCQRQ